jgi:hypothetical protein
MSVDMVFSKNNAVASIINLLFVKKTIRQSQSVTGQRMIDQGGAL